MISGLIFNFCTGMRWHLIVLVLPFLMPYVPIIIRHDKNDSDYGTLSNRFQYHICNLWLRNDVPDGVGTVIHPTWIVTAAHCAIEIQQKLEKGEMHSVMVAGVMTKVDTVIIHEGWASDEAYDIALLRIQSPVVEAEPVLLYAGDQELNKLVYVVGMGDTGNGIDGITGNDGRLRAATNRVDEATDYWLKWAFDHPEKNPDRVTEYEGISGPGDSGGPAFLIEDDVVYLAGISSGQSTRNTNGVEGVYGALEYYTRVSRYVDWIREIVK